MITVKSRATGEVLGEFAGLTFGPHDDYMDLGRTMVKVRDLEGRWIPFQVALTDVYTGG